MSQQIADRILLLTGEESPAQPVVILGAHAMGESPFLPVSERLGMSIYQAANPYRNRCLIAFSGHHYAAFSVSQWDFAKGYAAKMPSWPHKDSIAIADGVIIVKLSAN